jgi:hypothetical protein
MRVVLTILFAAVALWRIAVDWSATISHGYAFRAGTLGSLIAAHWPANYAQLVDGLQRSRVPFAWDPVGALVMSIPVALLFAALAGWCWLGRSSAR